MILRYQMAQRRGSKVTNCISLSLLLMVDLLSVGDEELLEDVQSGKEFSERVAELLQASINRHVGGIEVTGGG